MSKATDLTSYALEGYYGEIADCPHIATSPAAIAWELGQWLAHTSRSAPRSVAMSRGYSIKANDMLMRWHGQGCFERI